MADSNPVQDEPPAITVIQRFYEAETAYLTPGGGDFEALAATLDPECVLHQPASLPYGGEWRGPAGFAHWLQAFGAQWSSLDAFPGRQKRLAQGRQSFGFFPSHFSSRASTATITTTPAARRSTGKRCVWMP